MSDIYYNINDLIDDDEISAEELGFLIGYEEADKYETNAPTLDE